MTIAAISEPVPLAADDHGTVRVGGTRVTLETLVAAFQRGDSPEEIHDQYPSVALADVYAVLTYYLRHTGEVDAYIAGQEEKGTKVRARMQQICPSEGVRARLLARRQS